MSRRIMRRTATAAVSLSLVATAAAFAPPAQAAPSLKSRFEASGARAAGWQSSQLEGGRLVNSSGFDLWGQTVDTAFALAAAERTRPLARITRTLERDHAAYIGSGGERYSGALGKLLLAAKVLRQNPRDFGGTNLRVATLHRLTPASEGFERGRAVDKSQWGDFSNSLGQSFVVLGLARTGGVPQDAVNYLRKQQCSDGYFREKMTRGKSCDDSNAKKPSIDATALAVHALISASQHGANVPQRSIDKASRWLADKQRANGSIGPKAFGPNTNSAGLAGSAFWITGRKAAANKASLWVSRMQLTKALVGDGEGRRDIGAIAYNKASRDAAVKDGITKVTRDEFKIATPQAMLTLYHVSLARLLAP